VEDNAARPVRRRAADCAISCDPKTRVVTVTSPKPWTTQLQDAGLPQSGKDGEQEEYDSNATHPQVDGP